MIRLLHKGQPIPSWLYNVSVTDGFENHPKTSLGTITFLEFGFVVLLQGIFIKYRAGVYIDGARNITILDGGKGVIYCHTLLEFIATIVFFKKAKERMQNAAVKV